MFVWVRPCRLARDYQSRLLSFQEAHRCFKDVASSGRLPDIPTILAIFARCPGGTGCTMSRKNLQQPRMRGGYQIHLVLTHGHTRILGHCSHEVNQCTKVRQPKITVKRVGQCTKKPCDRPPIADFSPRVLRSPKRLALQQTSKTGSFCSVRRSLQFSERLRVLGLSPKCIK